MKNLSKFHQYNFYKKIHFQLLKMKKVLILVGSLMNNKTIINNRLKMIQFQKRKYKNTQKLNLIKLKIISTLRALISKNLRLKTNYYKKNYQQKFTSF